jgi:tellurite resistance protein TerC
MSDSEEVLEVPSWLWLVFGAFVLIGLGTGALSRVRGRDIGHRGAVVWTLAWIAAAFLYSAAIGAKLGSDVSEDFLSAYLVEKSLSIDNIFVFLVVFDLLGIPREGQHRVLFWGILGALVTRAAAIAFGMTLIHAWHDVIYVLGALLLYTGMRTAEQKPRKEGRVLKWIRRNMPVTSELHGERFFTTVDGRRVATPLFVALGALVFADLLFALDTLPAVFAVTEEPFVVYTSNVFALLGLHSLYHLLADRVSRVVYLRYGVAAILVFAGVKILTSRLFHLPHLASLAIVAAIVACTIVAGSIAKRREARGA